MSVTVWLIISGVFLIMELCTFEFVMGWFCFSGIVAMIFSLLGLPAWVQALVFIFLGILLMVCLRRPLLNVFLKYKRNKKTKAKKQKRVKGEKKNGC
ncbi:MAG: hypothetical protein IJS68_02560 [Clostridia bacterium]|nr:hypothetical protein [Clostridia bacterium]